MGWKQRKNETDEEFAERKRAGTEAARARRLEQRKEEKEARVNEKAKEEPLKDDSTDEPDKADLAEPSAPDTKSEKRDNNVEAPTKEDDDPVDLDVLEHDMHSEPDESEAEDENKREPSPPPRAKSPPSEGHEKS